jgi:hypothetical protein
MARSLYISAFLFFGVFVLLLYSLKLYGYCYRSYSFYSDAQLISAALLNEARQGNFPEDFNDLSDASTYLAEHPDCCVIARWNHPFLPNPLISSLFGERYVVVSIHSRQSKPNEFANYTNSLSVVNSCSSVVDRYSTGSES